MTARVVQDDNGCFVVKDGGHLLQAPSTPMHRHGGHLIGSSARPVSKAEDRADWISQTIIKGDSHE